MKPQKIVYKKQLLIHNNIIKGLKNKFLKDIKEVYLVGSLANGNFGRYIRKYKGYYGSDIDLVVIPNKIPKNWNYEGVFYNWHKRYNGGTIKIKDIEHPINFMIPFKLNINIFWKKVRDFQWKVEKIK